MRDVGRTLPPRNEVSRVGETRFREDRMNREHFAAVEDAVSRMRPLPIRAEGIFKHPADWTDEEVAYVADCLKLNIPIYRIAAMVHCEAHTLSDMIKKNPDLSRLVAEQKNNLYQESVFQLDRLMKAGNASVAMFVAERLGKDKGWSMVDQEKGEDDGPGGGKIVMGLIPDEALGEAAKFISEQTGVDASKVFESDPVKMQAAEDAEAERAAAESAEAERRREAELAAGLANGTIVEGEASEGHPSADPSAYERVEAEEAGEYGRMDGGMYGPGAGYDEDFNPPMEGNPDFFG